MFIGISRWFGRLSYSDDWVSVHESTCAHTRAAQRSPMPANWIGPFADQEALIAAAKRLGFTRLSRCVLCHGRPAHALSNTHRGNKREGPSTVLWVEDDAAFSYAATKCFRRAGFRVITADTVPEAFAVVRTTVPRLLIADILLAGEPHGLALGRTLKREFNVPVIFVTGYPELLEGQNLVGEVFTKPVEVEHLVSEAKHLMASN
jgi:CheY-like chemotaxis protein